MRRRALREGTLARPRRKPLQARWVPHSTHRRTLSESSDVTRRQLGPPDISLQPEKAL